MNLTPEERQLVFEQEKQRKQAEMKAKVESLSNEEREKIFQEELAKSKVFINSNSIKTPLFDKKWYIAICLFQGFIFMLFGLITYLIVFVLTFVIAFLWDRSNSDAIMSYKSEFNCPNCHGGLSITVSYVKQDLEQPQYFHFDCVHCNRSLDIHYEK
ncbi:hypothetical protein P9X05_28945 [Bacillus toyonensis]|uniref:hypothetical protein n=2 Tax=Bacillus cereus group TaxID=86661 RepID=UPI002DBCA387|nr:hypothetical protein [Bacillus toyonensis]MEC2395232.1 hypothetical protein [Bacillus toyonensis]